MSRKCNAQIIRIGLTVTCPAFLDRGFSCRRRLWGAADAEVAASQAGTVCGRSVVQNLWSWLLWRYARQELFYLFQSLSLKSVWQVLSVENFVELYERLKRYQLPYCASYYFCCRLGLWYHKIISLSVSFIRFWAGKLLRLMVEIMWSVLLENFLVIQAFFIIVVYARKFWPKISWRNANMSA